MSKILIERDRMLRSRHDARIQEEALLADQIKEQTGCTRDEALKAAWLVVEKDRHF